MYNSVIFLDSKPLQNPYFYIPTHYQREKALELSDITRGSELYLIVIQSFLKPKDCPSGIVAFKLCNNSIQLHKKVTPST